MNGWRETYHEHGKDIHSRVEMQRLQKKLADTYRELYPRAQLAQNGSPAWAGSESRATRSVWAMRTRIKVHMLDLRAISQSDFRHEHVRE